MKRACVVCATPTANGNRCPQHAPANSGSTHTGYSPYRDRAKQHRFRLAVLRRDNYTCQARDCSHVDPTGKTLRAAHIAALVDGGTYEPSNGITLCRACDRAGDPYAR